MQSTDKSKTALQKRVGGTGRFINRLTRYRVRRATRFQKRLATRVRNRQGQRQRGATKVATAAWWRSG